MIVHQCTDEFKLNVVVLAESFLDEFMDDRPSLQTFPAPVTQAACADVSITDSKELIDDPAPSSSSFVVMICVLLLKYYFHLI